MGALAIRTRTALFGIPRSEADFARRGFDEARPEARACLEAVGWSFIDGYNAWLSNRLDATLPEIPGDLRGFAVEGAAMASALLDHLSIRRSDHWASLLRDHAEHVYMIHVGAGWAVARLKLSLQRAVQRRDALLGWLVADGWGFHQTYFHPRQWASGRKRIPAGKGYLPHAVDQGIGRALWFVAGASPARVTERIQRFAEDRHADLWSGVGLAATYAGGCTPEELGTLVELAGAFQPQLAQGVAFAATARSVAGNITLPTCIAARVLTGRDASELYRLAMHHQPAAPHDPKGASYQTWRAQLTSVLTQRGAA